LKMLYVYYKRKIFYEYNYILHTNWRCLWDENELDDIMQINLFKKYNWWFDLWCTYLKYEDTFNY